MKKGIISIIGLGYVGLPLALLADKKGYKVIGVDIDNEKIELLKEKKIPFLDTKLEEKIAKCNIAFENNFNSIGNSDIIIVCVPTPVYENHQPNLEPLIGACESISKNLISGQLVIIESTINPGVCEETVIPILEKTGLKVDAGFFVAHCPERINPGDKNWDVENIPRVVGSNSKIGLARALQFYESILTSNVKPMGSLKEAEAVKIVENSFRDINIAFVNELAQSFSRLGIDIKNVIDGAATKPFAFMAHYPGCGVGGHCIPVDPYYLIEYAKKNGFEHDLLSWARRVNNGMPHFTTEKTLDALNEIGISIRGQKVALLGLAYKPNIDDCRESPSPRIVKLLEEQGAIVQTFDPYVIGKSAVKTLPEALTDAKVVVMATAHQDFLQVLTPELLKKYGVKIIIDGRNALPKEKYLAAGLIYKGIGR